MAADEKDDDLKKLDRGDNPEPEVEGAEGEEPAEGAEPEIEGGAEEAGDDGAAAPEPVIPKWRFDEAQRKARERYEAAERKLQDLEGKQQVKTKESDIEALSTSIEDLQNQYEDHLLAGDVEKARIVRKQLNGKQNELTEMRLTQQSQQTGRAAVEQMRFDAQLAQVEAKHPSLNPDSDDYSEDLATEVNEVLAAFQARGFTAAASLQKAVHYVLRPDKSEGKDADIIRSQRGYQARKKTAAAASATPPDLSKAGRNSDKGGKGDGLPDVTKLSPEQFDKLSDEERAQLRGDYLEED